MFFPCNLTLKGSNVFQQMAGLTEEIDIFDVLVGKRSFQSQCIAKVCSYTYAGFVLDKIAAISQLWGQSHQLVTEVINLTRLDSQIIPLPKSAIPIGVSTQTSHQPLPKTFPSAKVIFRIEGNTFSTGILLSNIRVYALLQFFGRTLEKGDYQTDFIPILAEGFPKVVQFDFAILYEALSNGRVTFERIDT